MLTGLSRNSGKYLIKVFWCYFFNSTEKWKQKDNKFFCYFYKGRKDTPKKTLRESRVVRVNREEKQLVDQIEL